MTASLATFVAPAVYPELVECVSPALFEALIIKKTTIPKTPTQQLLLTVAAAPTDHPGSFLF